MGAVTKTMAEFCIPADGIQAIGCEGHDEKIMTFVSFCLECYKARHGMTGRETAELFRRHGVEKYLCEEYDVSAEQANTDVAAIVEEWKKVGVVE